MTVTRRPPSSVWGSKFWSRRRVRRGRLHRSELLLLIVAAVVAAVLYPEHASAECGALDVGACTDAVVYSVWNGVASALWSIHRALLTLAYQLDNFRWWLVETVFTTVYQVLATAIEPALAPIAIVAVLIGILVFLVSPVFGRIEVVNIRRAMVWIVVAPAILAVSGTWMADSERLRTQVGAALFQAVSNMSLGDQGEIATLFGVDADDMTAATDIYAAAGGVCGTALARRGVTGVQIDDMAAALLYANAQDIHCPEKTGPSDDLPDGFFATPNPNYAYDGSIDMLEAALRQERINGIQRGVARLFMGLFPSILAVLAKLVDLIFSFALMLLWLGLPIGLLFVFFLDTAGGVTKLFRRLAGVFQASWTTSLMLGILFAALQAAATLGNASSYSGLSVLGIFLCAYALKLGVDILMSSFTAVSQTVAMATGSSDRLLQQSVMGTAAGLATGGAGTVATSLLSGRNYALARREGGSRRYAMGTALGRSKLLSHVGEAAASLGYQTDLTDGLYAGRRSRVADDRWRVLQAHTRSDSKQVYGDDNVPMGEKTERERVERALRRAERGTIANQTLHGARRLTDAGVQSAVGATKGTIAAGRAMRDDPIAATRTAASAAVNGGAALVRPAWNAASRRVRHAAWLTQTRADARTGMTRWPRAAIQAVASGMKPELEAARMRYEHGRLRIRPRYSDADRPQDAQQASRDELERLLREGKTVQFDGPDSLWFWDRQWKRPTQRRVDPNAQAAQRSAPADASNAGATRPPKPTARAQSSGKKQRTAWAHRKRRAP